MANIRKMADEYDGKVINWGVGVMVVIVIVGTLLSGLFLACNDGCETDTTRCNGERAEVCNTDGDWELAADCSDIDDFGMDIEWQCCLDSYDGLYSCLPADECEGGDGGV